MPRSRSSAEIKDVAYKYAHYLVCFVVVGLLISCLGNLQLFISKQSLNWWDPESSVLARFLWDCLLLLLFVAQHSLMALPWFKTKLHDWLTISISQRLLYITSTCCVLMVLILQWQSIPESYLWLIDTQKRSVLWTFFLLVHVLCWFILGLEVLLMDFGELAGVSQVQRFHNNQTPPLWKKAKRLQEIYSRMRHPGTTMLTIMLLVHLLMTLDRLLLASVLISYMIGRHSFEQTHYEFAEQHFTVKFSEKKSMTSVRYEYTKDE